MITSLAVSFFVAAFLIVYHHLLYPVLLNVISIHSKPTVSGPDSLVNDQPFPSVGILIPAFNEQAFIAEKLRNLAFLDYPRSKLSVFLVCDGCTDATAETARQTLCEPEFHGLNITIIDNGTNIGKLATINAYIPTIPADIIALSDVSALISIDALTLSALRFLDAGVGAVNGNYRLLNPGSDGERDYWRYQSMIKRGEECLGSVLGAHGAFYLFRKSLFTVLPLDTINDDFILPMTIVKQGYRVVYEDQVNAVELEKSDESLNWHRRIRIGMGNAQQVVRLRGLFLARWSDVGFSLASGKGLRVLMPFLMVYCFLSSLLLMIYSPLFGVFVIGQTLVYLMAFSSWIRGEDKSGRLCNVLFYLVSGYLASMVGVFKYLLNAKRVW